MHTDTRTGTSTHTRTSTHTLVRVCVSFYSLKLPNNHRHKAEVFFRLFLLFSQNQYRLASTAASPQRAPVFRNQVSFEECFGWLIFRVDFVYNDSARTSVGYVRRWGRISVDYALLKSRLITLFLKCCFTIILLIVYWLRQQMFYYRFTTSLILFYYHFTHGSFSGTKLN